LCDTEREVCLAYGSCQDKSDGTAKRYSYVIGTDGAVLQVYDTVKPAEHIEEVLAFIDSL
jgi:peroxiredoxin